MRFRHPAGFISLYNPLGGVMRGLPEIRPLYRRIFEGEAQVWVEFHDVVEYADATTVVFAGRSVASLSAMDKPPWPLRSVPVAFFAISAQKRGGNKSTIMARLIRRRHLTVSGGGSFNARMSTPGVVG